MNVNQFLPGADGKTLSRTVGMSRNKIHFLRFAVN